MVLVSIPLITFPLYALGKAVIWEDHAWNGCRVDAVRYDAKRSAALLAAEHSVTASGGSSSISTAIDEYGMDNVVYLSNGISCHAGSQNSSQDGWGSWYAWNPGSARAEHGWIFIDEGY